MHIFRNRFHECAFLMVVVLVALSYDDARYAGESGDASILLDGCGSGRCRRLSVQEGRIESGRRTASFACRSWWSSSVLPRVASRSESRGTPNTSKRRRFEQLLTRAAIDAVRLFRETIAALHEASVNRNAEVVLDLALFPRGGGYRLVEVKDRAIRFRRTWRVGCAALPLWESRPCSSA